MEEKEEEEEEEEEKEVTKLNQDNASAKAEWGSAQAPTSRRTLCRLITEMGEGIPLTWLFRRFVTSDSVVS